MATPDFSRVEIRTETPDHLRTAANELRSLAAALTIIAERGNEPHIMRLAAHDAIRQVSGKLRGTAR